MYDPPESTLCEIAQLYVETRRMRCCASLLLADLQGYQCLLGHLGLAPLLDAVKLEGRPLDDEVCGRYLTLTPIAQYLYPSIQVISITP